MKFFIISYIVIFLSFTFKEPNDLQKKELLFLAIESNDMNNPRSISYNEALYFLRFREDSFIEIILDDKDPHEILGFYSIQGKQFNNKNNYWEMELGHLFVNIHHTKKGIGTVLFKRAIAQANSIGITRLYWECLTNARGFYNKLGGRQISEITNTMDPEFKNYIYELYIKP